MTPDGAWSHQHEGPPKPVVMLQPKITFMHERDHGECHEHKQPQPARSTASGRYGHGDNVRCLSPGAGPGLAIPRQRPVSPGRPWSHTATSPASAPRRSSGFIAEPYVRTGNFMKILVCKPRLLTT
jgi:hypothetical protein